MVTTPPLPAAATPNRGIMISFAILILAGIGSVAWNYAGTRRL